MKQTRFLLAMSLVACLLTSRVLMADDATDATDPAMIAAKQLSGQLEAAMKAGDAEAADKIFDMDSLLDLSMSNTPVTPDFAKGFRSGAKNSLSIFSQIIGQIKPTGSYHLLRIRTENGEVHALFRMLGSGGLNYHEWIVGKDPLGQYKFVDVYIAVSGERMSQTIHRLFVSGAAGQNQLVGNKEISQHDSDLAANLDKFTKMTAGIQTGKYQEVLDTYKTLPKSLQEDKAIMILRFGAAEHLRDSDIHGYTDAMADFQRLFPGDASVEMICIDMFFAAKQFPAAHQAVAHLETFTGGDPYLLFLDANIDFTEGGDLNFAAAKKLYRQAIKEEPTFADAYWGLVTVSLKEKDFDQTAALLTEIEQKLPLKISNLENLPLYGDFVQSDAYAKWKAAHDSATQAAPANPSGSQVPNGGL